MVLGVAFGWVKERWGAAITARIRQKPQNLHERYFAAMYAGALLWIVIAAVVSGWLSLVLLRRML
jgi:hypothetical protein